MTDRVPKRKTHTKSRKGCLQCKQRHTKCNETHPRCANCTRLEIDCTWPRQTLLNGSSFHSNPQRPERDVPVLFPSQLWSRPELASTPVQLSVQDLRLLHHWTTKTYATMHSHVPSKHHLWQNDFVEIAFQHPFLLHGILAIAAMHKSITTPMGIEGGLLYQANVHINNALSTYREHLENPSPETAAPMFLLSIILVLYNLGSAQLEEPERPMDAILHCFRLVRGVRVVLEPHWHRIQASEVSMLISQAIDSPEPSPDDEQVEILRLKELVSPMLEEDPRNRATCIHAIEELHKTWIKVRICPPEQDPHAVMFVWPAAVEDFFLELMSLHRPVATIILVHFAVLLCRATESWWVQGWPQRIIRAARALLGDKPELQQWLSWPSQLACLPETTN
ncbi:hypothetical protein K469DRAFT_661295 [Zopfia rhizophila CBS 207.26]|uniref:Zn(2)-C6 fungal-type domain-containing protein n=1 Tax=Zopfia rhizophila CBS 207.26 TaxID=1314779 RepID=A0A6A6E7H8_9PEZI|nr:hypothetical protein K469DRAFT_661295 [Zopfia rhizophila CBS 207.26]